MTPKEKVQRIKAEFLELATIFQDLSQGSGTLEYKAEQQDKIVELIALSKEELLKAMKEDFLQESIEALENESPSTAIAVLVGETKRLLAHSDALREQLIHGPHQHPGIERELLDAEFWAATDAYGRAKRELTQLVLQAEVDALRAKREEKRLAKAVAKPALLFEEQKVTMKKKRTYKTN